MDSGNVQGSLEGEQQAVFRCARCGVESPERTCFIIPERYGQPPHDVRCVTCEQRRLDPSTTYATASVVITLVWPVVLWLGAQKGAAELSLPAFLFACCLSPVAIVAHELGHAVTAYLVGLRVGAIGIGFGRVVFKFEFRELPVRLHMWPISGRVYLGASSTRFLRTRVWIATLMGPMTNVLLLAAALAWWPPLESVFGSPAVAVWCIVNALLVIFALVPTHVNDLGQRAPTDGLALLTISNRTAEEMSLYLLSAPLIRALCRFEDGNFAGAKQQVVAALEHTPQSVPLRVMQAACSMWEAEYQAGLEAVAPLVSHCASESAGVRAAIYNNAAFGLVMARLGVAGNDPDLLEAERLSGESYRLYPCMLAYRSTRALVLAATGRADECLRLLDYPLFQSARPRERASGEVVRAFALRQLGRVAEAEVAAATAVQLDASISRIARSLGVTPGSAARANSAVPHAQSFHVTLKVEEEPLSGAGRFMARLAGLVLLLFGIASGALAGLGMVRNLSSHLAMSVGVSVTLMVLALVSAFCCAVGYRLALYRPNRYGSIVSPGLWVVLAVVLGSLGLAFCAMVIVSPRGAGGYMVGAAGSFALAGLCWKGREARKITAG